MQACPNGLKKANWAYPRFQHQIRTASPYNPRTCPQSSAIAAFISCLNVELFEDDIHVAPQLIVIRKVVLDLIGAVHDGGVVFFAYVMSV